MKSRISKMLLAALAVSCAGLPLSVSAQDAAADATNAAESPLRQGSYFAPMGTGLFVDDDSELDDSYGGTLAIGYRKDWWAMEIAPSIVDLDGINLETLALNGLLFPFGGLPNFYLTVGLSGSNYDDFQTPTQEIDFNTVNGDAGLGYIFPLSVGRYEFGIRAEARYRVSAREEDYNDTDQDFDAPDRFKHALVNIGLQLPLGLKAVPPPPPEPVVVVPPPPAAICGDGLDNDADGVIDFPADPGCISADDADETDPPKCVVPKAGERISLLGCGTGDVIVLNGVNFEFDQDRLTPNARTILDNVAEELTAYPDISVELGGHTDARGSDDYNQGLSERRAAAVREYLMSKGIAESRMTSVGYGETQPVADNDSDEGRELNRRVELKVTGGMATAAPAAPAAARGPEPAPTPTPQ